jgi:hypothetical protein
MSHLFAYTNKKQWYQVIVLMSKLKNDEKIVYKLLDVNNIKPYTITAKLATPWASIIISHTEKC